MMDAFGVPDRVAVFGGGSDIAIDLMSGLAGRGVREFVLAVHHIDGAAAARERVAPAGATVRTEVFEAADTGSHRDLIERMWAGGDVDMAVVAFGVLGVGAPRDRDASLAVLEVNLMGAASILELVADRMQRQGRGLIVVLSSVAAVRPRASNYPYAASKAGLDAYARGLGDAVAGTGVRVMVVRPGFVKTKMTEGLSLAPLSVDPPAVTRAVLEAMSGRRSVVWVPTAVRPLMWVLGMLPDRIYRKITAGR